MAGTCIIELDVQCSSTRVLDDYFSVVPHDISMLITSYNEPELVDAYVLSCVPCTCGHNVVLEYLRFPVTPALEMFTLNYQKYLGRLHLDKYVNDDIYERERDATYRRLGPGLWQRVKKWYDSGPLFVLDIDEKELKQYTNLVRPLTKIAQMIMKPCTDDAGLQICERLMTNTKLPEHAIQQLHSERNMVNMLDEARHFFTEMSTSSVPKSVLDAGYTFGSDFFDSYYRVLETCLYTT